MGFMPILVSHREQYASVNELYLSPSNQVTSCRLPVTGNQQPGKSGIQVTESKKALHSWNAFFIFQKAPNTLSMFKPAWISLLKWYKCAVGTFISYIKF